MVIRFNVPLKKGSKNCLYYKPVSTKKPGFLMSTYQVHVFNLQAGLTFNNTDGSRVETRPGSMDFVRA